MAQKVGEEAVEAVVSAPQEESRSIEESADLEHSTESQPSTLANY
ncbi:MAG TPA: hypothetical protein VLV83_20210 [Acidobacteriota bacterium]|nr:hypothetical protein [Acidobacteriota bacterium]